MLIVEKSPHGNLEASVEQDDRAAFLYVVAPENEDFGVKSCWIRNLQPAPEALDVAGMREGRAPMMPRAHCAFPEGQPPLSREKLRLVWLPEGDGVALMEGAEMLAAMPGWSGMDGFYGYARDAAGRGPLAWKLEDEAHFLSRVRAAETFWAPWDRNPEAAWREVQSLLLDTYERHLGAHFKYYAIDGGNWPPRALARFRKDGVQYLCTLGISNRPQPAVEMYAEDPAPLRRFELAAAFDDSVAEDTILKVCNYLSGQANLPWNRFTFLGDTHTLPCNAFEGDAGLRPFNAALLLKEPADLPFSLDARVGGDPVNLLWLIPLQPKERDLARDRSTAALLAKFPQGRPSCVIRKRKSVIGLFG